MPAASLSRDACLVQRARVGIVHPVRPSSVAPVMARQKGAILVLTVFIFFVLCAALMVVFNTAQVTSEKRQLVNAADAIAFSTASVAAEGLNYTSYTNRAMVANYESVGMMTGMWSVLGMSDQYWKNSATLFGALAQLTKYIPWVGPTFSVIANGISTFGKGWQKITHAVRFGTKLLAHVGTAAISLTNYALYASQQVHLASTIAALGEMQQPLLNINAPKAEYDPATISYQVVKGIYDFGTMMKLHRPPGKFTKDMTSRWKPNGGEPFNLVHRLMMDEINSFMNPFNGRQLLPNAVGLWMSDGCQFGPWAAFNGILTGLQTNGLTSIFPFLGDSNWIDGAAAGIEIFMNTIGLLASPIICLYDRVGGTRIIQMQDGSYGWSSVDVMPMSLLGFQIPLAGGVTMSRVGKQGTRPGKSIPGDLEAFAKWGETTSSVRNKYWGESTSAEDCVYLTLPSGDVYEPRLDGACLSLAPGAAKHYYQRGALNYANGATWDAMKGNSALFNFENGQNESIMAPLLANMESAASSVSNLSTSTIHLPAGSADVSGGHPVGGVMAGMPAAGGGLDAPTPESAATINALREQFRNFSDPYRFLTQSMSLGDLRDLTRNLITSNISIPDDVSSAGAGPGGFVKFILDALGIGKFYDLLTMRSSMGTEVLGFTKGNGANFSPDLGLPIARFGLWELRHSEVGSYQSGDLDSSTLFEATPEIQEAALNNLGPTFTVGLRQSIGTVELAEKKHMTPGKLVLPNWDVTQNTPYLRAIGKARVYYRAPLERWTTRQQLVTQANLMLPYWNARLEGLSYPEKALFSLTQLSGKL